MKIRRIPPRHRAPAMLTDRAVRELEEVFELKREALEILGQVVTEWRTDPTSVQCFDLRVVKRAGEVLDLIKKLEPFT